MDGVTLFCAAEGLFKGSESRTGAGAFDVLVVDVLLVELLKALPGTASSAFGTLTGTGLTFTGRAFETFEAAPLSVPVAVVAAGLPISGRGAGT